MAYSKEDRDRLRRAYVFDNLALEKAADLFKVSHPTARRWKARARANGDDWDKVRSAHTLAGGDVEDIARQLLTNFVVQFKTTMDLVKDDDSLDAKTRVMLLTSLSDSYHKAIAANRKLMPVTDKLAQAVAVLNQLGEYIKTHKPDALPVFIDILEPFGDEVARMFG